ncbi:hypothetical protein P691DRAFT_564475 [Macrolepiota fuliginosa MF-IS2]|uniref:Uncharacterized protein n=1 Tax=Macrolepiota fuliginosa MF-IS2 TaxID=1400762 RepID=A0A9P5XLV3_9AGAR|nr:hypothetical protein P691DRAFT_564475 [Macrolepiota fuliginosa MF-IS2]
MHNILVPDDHDMELMLTSATVTLPQSTTCDVTEGRLEEPPTKKRRISPAAESRPQSSSRPAPIYLGDILVGNAWSTVSGKGYVKLGESVVIQRDGPSDGYPGSKPQKGKTSDKARKATGKKQVTLTSMLKPSIAKPARRKVDTVVRVVNHRGFGIISLDFQQRWPPGYRSCWIST